MKAVQVVLDEELLKELDRRAHRLDRSRSEVIRDTLRAQFRRLINAEADEQVRLGYQNHPEKPVLVKGPSGVEEAWEEEDWSDILKEEKSAAFGSRRRTRKGRS